MIETEQSEIRRRQIRNARIKAKKRRRMKKRILRDSVLMGMLLTLILVVYGIGKLVSFLFGGTDAAQSGSNTEKQTEQIEKVNVDTSSFSKEYLDYYNQLVDMEKKYPKVANLYKDFSEYPVDLLALVVRNPETIQFVKDYPEKHSVDVVVNVKDDYKMGEIPLFIQWDERWGYAQYGDNMMAINACGPTCVSMVTVGLTGNTNYNPKYVADLSSSLGYYTESGTSWALMQDGIAQMGVTGYTINITADSIYSELKKNHPIIASVGPGDFTSQGHFIVLKGIDKKNRIIVNDPNSRERSKKHWDIEVLLSQIKSLWAYTV